MSSVILTSNTEEDYLVLIKQRMVELLPPSL